MNQKKFTTAERLKTLEQAFLVVTQQLTKLANAVNKLKKLEDEKVPEQ